MKHKDISIDIGCFEGIPAYTDNNMNPHINLYGKSGSGKTTEMIRIIESFNSQGGTVFIPNYSGIFDKNQIYEPYLEYFDSHCQEYGVHDEGIKIDLFKRKSLRNGVSENMIDVIGGVCDVISDAVGLTEKQRPILRYALEKLTESEKYDEKGIKGLSDYLRQSGDPKAIDVMEKLYYILEHNVFRPSKSDEDGFFKRGFINLYNLSGFNPSVQMLITEVLLNEIYRLGQAGEFLDLPVYVVLDEVQNFSNASIVPRLLSEARKYGIGIITGTQLILKRSTNKIIQRLPGAGINLHFTPQFNRITEVARNINPAEAARYAMELGNLKPGEFIATGSFRVANELFNDTPLKISAYIDKDDTFLEKGE